MPLRVAVIRLGRTLLCGSSDLPGSRAGRATPPPLFGLAPRGVCPAGRITPAAVRSYRTISPLPRLAARRYLFCGTFRIRFLGPRPLAGTLPCGDRTFLPRAQRAPRERLPVRQPHVIIVAPYGRRLGGPMIRPEEAREGAGEPLRQPYRSACRVSWSDEPGWLQTGGPARDSRRHRGAEDPPIFQVRAIPRGRRNPKRERR